MSTFFYGRCAEAELMVTLTSGRYLAQVQNTKLTNASEVFVDRNGRFFPVSYSVAPLHGGYQHGAVVVSLSSGLYFDLVTDPIIRSAGVSRRVRRGTAGRRQDEGVTAE